MRNRGIGTCRICRQSYQRTSPTQLSCSPACAKAAVRQRRPLLTAPRSCEHCGASFEPQNRKQRFCMAPACRAALIRLHHPLTVIPERACDICGAVYRPKNRRGLTCSAECSLKLERMRSSDWHRGIKRAVAVDRPIPLLTRGQQPSQAPELESVDDVSEQRRVWCVEYEACLDHAAARDWQGWTCAGCNVTTEVPVEARRAESMRLVQIKATERRWEHAERFAGGGW